MMTPASQYLTLRSLGAPAVLLSLAMQGVFRGLKDTKTPLYATGTQISLIFFCLISLIFIELLKIVLGREFNRQFFVSKKSLRSWWLVATFPGQNLSRCLN